jgi:hypothetical protein
MTRSSCGECAVLKGDKPLNAQQDTVDIGVRLALPALRQLKRRFSDLPNGNKLSMGERKKPQQVQPTEEIIAAFDREQAEARELKRRHTEAVRDSRNRDTYVKIERRRRPR